MRSASARSFIAATKRSKIGRSTYTRSEHRQTCPVLVKLERVTPATALSKSQSAKTTAAFLPPSSNETSFTPSATAFMMVLPVRDSPVKVIASISGWRDRNSPAEPPPKPCTRLKTPGGTPASCMTSASSVAVPGVSSEGLITTALPQASAGATFQVISSIGRFHGEMIATTPWGLRTV